MTEEVARFLNAINSELEEQSLTPREFDDELRDSGELVFEYRDGNLHQIGYFPLRAVNDPIPIWAYNKDGHRGGRSHRHGRLVRFFIRFRKFRVGRLVQMSIKKARGVQPTGEEETVYLL